MAHGTMILAISFIMYTTVSVLSKLLKPHVYTFKRFPHELLGFMGLSFCLYGAHMYSCHNLIVRSVSD